MSGAVVPPVALVQFINQKYWVEMPVPSSLEPFEGYTNWEIIPTYNAAMSYSTEDGYMCCLV